ncbi:MAG: hypothetical protein M1401_02830 [Chloroflexi bacterium]|nr:hypothetical protein [Chloroflexota bacterium]
MQEEEKFAAVLDGCCRRYRAGEPLAGLLAQYPEEYRGELARLVPIGERLAELGQGPGVEFQGRLADTLSAAYADARRRPSPSGGFLSPLWRTLRRLPTVAVLVVALLLLGGGGAGVVQAADGSLPDSPLYNVKAAREWVRLLLAGSGEAKLNVYNAQIAERTRELERAVRLNKPRRVVLALSLSLSYTVDRAVDQVSQLQAQGRPQPAARAVSALHNAERQIDGLSAEASLQVRPILQRLKAFLASQADRLAVPPSV